MVPALISGFLDGNGQNAFQICFQAIISDLDIDPDRAIHVIPAPSETSRKPLSMGVPHCLVYGVPQAVRRATGRARTKSRSRSLSRHDSGGCDRGRNRHRVILKERTGDKSLSRSRSPKADQNIMGDVTRRNENQGTQKPSFAEMERNPQLYCIGADSISAYMEPHKPDLSLIRRIENGNNTVYKVEVVIEITSISRYSGTFDNAVIGATEQCLYSCLASLQSNQTCIYGIIILVEGMKALKVVKEDNQWNVYETDLIQFCEGVLLKRMLYMVFNSLL